MKILILLLLPLSLFSQEVLKKKDDKVMISSTSIDLEQGKKYVIQSNSGEALIGVYKNLSGGNYVAKILEGDLNVGDSIDSFAKKSTTTYSSSNSITSSTGKIYQPFNFGIHLGGNYSGGTDTEETIGSSVETKFDSGIGFQGGVVFDYNFNPSMSLSTKLSFATYVNTLDNIDGLGTNQENKSTTISIEPRFKYKFLSDSVGYKLAYGFTGVRIGKLLSMETIATNPAVASPTKFDFLDDQTAAALNTKVADILIDIPIGVGMNFKLKSLTNTLVISPNFTYYLQVGDITEHINGSSGGFRVSTMAFNIDVLF